MGFALAMLVIVSSSQPIQAQFHYGERSGHCTISNPASADPYENVDAALYITEESGEEFGDKSRAHCLASDSDDPPSLAAAVPTAEFYSSFRWNLPESVSRTDGERFRSSLKTGPPSV